MVGVSLHALLDVRIVDLASLPRPVECGVNSKQTNSIQDEPVIVPGVMFQQQELLQVSRVSGAEKNAHEVLRKICSDSNVR